MIYISLYSLDFLEYSYQSNLKHNNNSNHDEQLRSRHARLQYFPRHHPISLLESNPLDKQVDRDKPAAKRRPFASLIASLGDESAYKLVTRALELVVKTDKSFIAGGKGAKIGKQYDGYARDGVLSNYKGT